MLGKGGWKVFLPPFLFIWNESIRDSVRMGTYERVVSTLLTFEAAKTRNGEIFYGSLSNFARTAGLGSGCGPARRD